MIIIVEDIAPTQDGHRHYHERNILHIPLEMTKTSSMGDEVAFDDRPKADTTKTISVKASPVLLPSDRDIVCGRGHALDNHPGNKVFREIVQQHVPKYRDPTTSRKSKTAIGRMIYDQTRSDTMQFVKKVNGTWTKLCKKEAKLKIGHALRDSTSENIPATIIMSTKTRECIAAIMNYSVSAKEAAIASSMSLLGDDDELLSEGGSDCSSLDAMMVERFEIENGDNSIKARNAALGSYHGVQFKEIETQMFTLCGKCLARGSESLLPGHPPLSLVATGTTPLNEADELLLSEIFPDGCDNDNNNNDFDPNLIDNSLLGECDMFPGDMLDCLADEKYSC